MTRLIRRALVAALPALFVACSSSAPPPPELASPGLDVARILDVLWEWEGTTAPTDERVIEDPSRYTLRFESGDRVAVRADCNRGWSKYEINGTQKTLVLRHGIMTRAACPPDSEDFIFLQETEDVARFRFEGNKLVLELATDEATMTFRPIPIQSR